MKNTPSTFMIMIQYIYHHVFLYPKKVIGKYIYRIALGFLSEFFLFHAFNAFVKHAFHCLGIAFKSWRVYSFAILICASFRILKLNLSNLKVF